jgi:hypothetical protein
MNISNLLTVSAAVTIAVAGTIYSQSGPVVTYYAITSNGCPVVSTPNCTTSGSILCTVVIDGVTCNVRKNADAGSPCAVTMFRN